MGTAQNTRAGVGGRGVLEGAFSLLEAVNEAGEAGLTRLAAATGLPKSTAHRLLEQLVLLGALERTGLNYRMGPRLFRLGQSWHPHPGLVNAARAPIRHLAGATGATVCVCVLREGRTMAVAGVPGEVNELVPLRPGATWPWATAAGRAIVAHAPPTAPLNALPPNWDREAADIRQRGAAFDFEEIVEGVNCVAVPLRGPHGVPAALAVLADSSQPLKPLTERAMRAAKSISASLP